MIPQVLFPDVELAVVTYLAAELDDSVGTFYPASSTDAPVVPFVQIADDGTPGNDYPVTERTTVRVTVWHTQPTLAKALAAKVKYLMATYPLNADVGAVIPLTRLGGPTRDPDTHFLLVTQTFRVSMMSHPLPSIISVSPTHGQNNGMNPVLLTGVGFAGATSIEFGGFPGTTFVYPYGGDPALARARPVAWVEGNPLTVDVAIYAGATLLAVAPGAYTYDDPA